MTYSNVKQAVPFFAVRDIELSLEFYVSGLGGEMTKHWLVDGAIRWCWVRIGEAAVMLQQFPTDGPDSRKLEGKLGEGVTICFICEDAIDFYRELKDAGLEPSRPFVGNGLWVTSIKDPDGYRLDFESPTDAPEESEFTDDVGAPGLGSSDEEAQ